MSARELLRNIKILRVLKNKVTAGLSALWNALNSLGSNRKCYVCGATFFYFTKYRNGSKDIHEFRKKLKNVGSDVDNFGCMYCGCHDRERHLFMYFDKLGLWDAIRSRKVLHFAPEKNLQRRIEEAAPAEYILADLYPKSAEIRKIDATSLPFDDDTIDFLVANHILEHIPDFRRALSEFYRALRPGGIAILQTPYSRLLKYNFEDDGINTDELRLYFHGLEDHVRTFGEYHFFKSLEEANFELLIQKHRDCFDSGSDYYYGVPIDEDLIMVKKPLHKDAS